MKSLMSKLLYVLAAVILAAILIIVIWQPVLPSSFIIQKMVDSIDCRNLTLEEPMVIRFELSGKGGGDYNIVASSGKAELTEGNTERADLILYMEASDFNDLMFSFAKGEADEFTFIKFIISNKLKFAGDRSALEILLSSKGGSK